MIKSCKYASWGAISAAYIVIIPGMINFGEKKSSDTTKFPRRPTYVIK